MKKILFSISLAAVTIFTPIFSRAQAVNITVKGLKNDVTIRRDSRGIPYVEAQNDADLSFAQGYVMAGDRLFQMDMMRRVARGRTAEIFGERTLDEDKRWRRFGFASIVEETLPTLTPELRSSLENYARGVNAYISTLDERSLPVEFRILRYKPEPWLPTDSLIIGKILSDALSSTWRLDLIRASLKDLPKDKYDDLTNPVTPFDVVLFGKDERPSKTVSGILNGPISPETMAVADREDRLRGSSLERIGLYAKELAASNNWVISGKRTADGRAMLANDPHLSPSTPGIWYLIDLRSPSVHVAGVTIPGAPGVSIGHNDQIAWGMTNVGPDVQDLYAETFNEAGEYKTPTGWAKPLVKKETILVRKDLQGSETVPHSFETVETRNGVIITDEVGQKFALKWTARDPKYSEFAAFPLVNRAKDWKSFKSALKEYGGPTQNFVFADINGNIGWYAAGPIPIRRSGSGELPYDGATGAGDWLGIIPFESLPNLYDPPSGFIVTANQRIAGTSYPYQQMTRVYGSARARRIYDLLSANSKVSMDDSRDIQMDVYSWPLASFARTLVADGSISAESLTVLKEWDGRMTPDSRGAVIANEMRNCVAGKIADDNKPVPSSLILQKVVDMAISERSARWLPGGFKTYGELYSSCDKSVRESLTSSKVYGSDPTGWIWGKTSMSRFPHPLASIPFIGSQFATPNVAISGSSMTPNVGSSVSMRLIASPGNWDATRHVVPMGESGDPASVHYKDQFELWRTGVPALLPFSKDAVQRAAVSVTVMKPN